MSENDYVYIWNSLSTRRSSLRTYNLVIYWGYWSASSPDLDPSRNVIACHDGRNLSLIKIFANPSVAAVILLTKKPDTHDITCLVEDMNELWENETIWPTPAKGLFLTHLFLTACCIIHIDFFSPPICSAACLQCDAFRVKAAASDVVPYKTQQPDLDKYWFSPRSLSCIKTPPVLHSIGT